jgi:hypothetical protein
MLLLGAYGLGACEPQRHLARSEESPEAYWCAHGSAGLSGWAVREGAPTIDVSEQFAGLLARVRAGEAVLPPEAGAYAYLLVPGLGGERYPGYMDANEQRLRDRGLGDVRRSSIDSDASVSANAGTICDEIMDAESGGKRVVVIGQSKGGVDTAAALATCGKEQRQGATVNSRVRQFISLQAPYGGTPIATDLLGCDPLERALGRLVGGLWGVDEASLSDLSYASRREFVRANPLPPDVPILSLATSRNEVGSLLWLTSQYIQTRYGWPSDGLVVRDDAIIPGSRVVVLRDMDHAEAVLVGVPGLRNYHPAEVTEALVALALQ